MGFSLIMVRVLGQVYLVSIFMVQCIIMRRGFVVIRVVCVYVGIVCVNVRVIQVNVWVIWVNVGVVQVEIGGGLNFLHISVQKVKNFPGVRFLVEI